MQLKLMLISEALISYRKVQSEYISLIKFFKPCSSIKNQSHLRKSDSESEWFNLSQLHSWGPSQTKHLLVQTLWQQGCDHAIEYHRTKGPRLLQMHSF